MLEGVDVGTVNGRVQMGSDEMVKLRKRTDLPARANGGEPAVGLDRVLSHYNASRPLHLGDIWSEADPDDPSAEPKPLYACGGGGSWLRGGCWARGDGGTAAAAATTAAAAIAGAGAGGSAVPVDATFATVAFAAAGNDAGTDGGGGALQPS